MSITTMKKITRSKRKMSWLRHCLRKGRKKCWAWKLRNRYLHIMLVQPLLTDFHIIITTSHNLRTQQSTRIINIQAAFLRFWRIRSIRKWSMKEHIPHLHQQILEECSRINRTRSHCNLHPHSFLKSKLLT